MHYLFEGQFTLHNFNLLQSLEFHTIPLQSIGNLLGSISPTPVAVADTGGGGGGGGRQSAPPLVSNKIKESINDKRLALRGHVTLILLKQEVWNYKSTMNILSDVLSKNSYFLF